MQAARIVIHDTLVASAVIGGVLGASIGAVGMGMSGDASLERAACGAVIGGAIGVTFPVSVPVLGVTYYRNLK